MDAAGLGGEVGGSALAGRGLCIPPSEQCGSSLSAASPSYLYFITSKSPDT